MIFFIFCAILYENNIRKNGDPYMNEKAKEFTSKHAEIWKFIKFLFTGASTSILQLAVQAICFYLLFKNLSDVNVEVRLFTLLGIDDSSLQAILTYFVSNIIGYAAAFIMNRKLTFQSDANPVVSMILYFIMVVCTILFNTWLGSVITTWLTAHGYLNFFTNMLAGLIVMTIPTIWTYPLQRFVIHRKKKPAAETAESSEPEAKAE